MVAGYGADAVRAGLRQRRSTSSTTSEYASTNSLYSLWLARDVARRRVRRAQLRRAVPPPAAGRPADRALRRCPADGGARRRRLLGRGDEGPRPRRPRHRRSPRRSIRPTPTARTSASPSSAPTAPAVLIEEMTRLMADGGVARLAAGRVRRVLPAPPAARRREPRVSVDRDRFSRRLLARLHGGPARAIEAAIHRVPAAAVTRRETASCMNASTTSASARSRSAPTPTICIRAGSIARRSATCATASRAMPGSWSSPATSAPARRRCCRRCCADLDRQTSVARLVNTMLDARELIEAVMLDFGLDPAPGAEQAAPAARSGAVPGRAAAGRPPRAARHRRSAEPQPGGARRSPDALEPRDREVEAAADRPGRPAEPARPAGAPGARAAAAAGHGELSPASRSTSDETAAYINHRLQRAAIGAPLEFSRDVTDLIHRHSGGVPAQDQRHRRRDPAVRLRRGAAGHRRRADAAR